MRHLAAEGHMTTSLGNLFEFPEFLGSTMYSGSGSNIPHILNFGIGWWPVDTFRL